MGDLYLDKETKEILAELPPRGKSPFVREAIKEKARSELNLEPKEMIIPEVEILE